MADASGKLLVLFGATGATGSHLLRFALEDGLRVRAYVRSPQKIPEELRTHPHLELAEGDFDQPEAIQAALEGADYVICTAGNAKLSKKRRVMPGVVENIVAGMRKHGVKRLVYQAGAFSSAPETPNPFFVRAIMRPILGTLLGISGMLLDNDAVIAFLHGHARDIDWTITRPGLIKEEPSKGPIRITDAGGPSHFIDLARFNLELVQKDEQIHQCPYVGY